MVDMPYSRSTLAKRICFAVLFAALVPGCSQRQTADQVLDAALAQQGTSRKNVFPLAGKVTIDGKPLQLTGRQKIIVTLHDAANKRQGLLERPFVECNAGGEFAFRTYGDRDGVPPGNYVLTFTQLVDRGKRGYLGPDGLKNLYNDPDKSEFSIAHTKGGRTDYVFDLKIEGRESVAAGPRAVQSLAEMRESR
jgi:hypothetical protein